MLDVIETKRLQRVAGLEERCTSYRYHYYYPIHCGHLTCPGRLPVTSAGGLQGTDPLPEGR